MTGISGNNCKDRPLTDTQVLIVGAGPVGMTAGLLLAGFGIESIILESGSFGDPIGSRSLCTQGDVLEVLERVGISNNLMSEGVTWHLGRTYYRRHELFRITFPRTGREHFPPFVNIGQDRIEYWLERRVGAEPLTGIRYRHQVVGISNRPDGVRVTVLADGRTHTVTGRYAICAGGARDPGRKLMGIGFPGRSFDDRFLICDIRAALPFGAERRFYFDPPWNPDRQVLIHPQAGSVWRIDWQVPPDFDLDQATASGALESLIRQIVGDQEYEIVWMSVYRFHQRLADRFAKGRSFLAGDAAHLYAPFGARGLNSGIQDAENLAWKLAYVLHGWAPGSLLGTYETERRAAARENLAVTGATMDFLVPADQAGWNRRRALLDRAITDQDARRLIDSGRLAEPYAYLASPLTTRGPEETRESAVAPGTLCPDGPCQVRERPDAFRLRQLFGAGLVILYRGNPPGLPRSPGPIDIYDLDGIDKRGRLGPILGIEPGQAALIRPDGHIAAIVPARQEFLNAAAGRAIGENT